MNIPEEDRKQILEAGKFLEDKNFKVSFWEGGEIIDYLKDNLQISICYEPYDDISSMSIHFKDINKSYDLGWIEFVRSETPRIIPHDRLQDALSILSYIEQYFEQVTSYEYCEESDELIEEYFEKIKPKNPSFTDEGGIMRGLNIVIIRAQDKKIYENIAEFKTLLEQLLSTDEDLILHWDADVPEEWAMIEKKDRGLACMMNIRIGLAFIRAEFLTERSIKAMDTLYVEPVTDFEMKEWFIHLDVLKKTTLEIKWSASPDVIDTMKLSLQDLYRATV